MMEFSTNSERDEEPGSLFFDCQDPTTSSDLTPETWGHFVTNSSGKFQKVSPEKNRIPSALDVAAYIVERLGEISTMKLQKLVYYSQAWSLVWDERPLFKEPIEAWANGPVVRDLYDYHRGAFSIGSIQTGNPNRLDSTARETINAVLDFYGNKSAQYLIQLSHSEEPWLNARKGLKDGERGSRLIPNSFIAEYYSSL
ncbi:type II toxin-antitoxin system antitoxin SocA domain-containing protein [Pelagicoccus sp. SDUM812003]|uniref:Panacea domain-containing protein n=1 Tax=Pelagicoccus sp. SDUM812003 TaxID=3041267 RepID=UPI00280EE506|nr:type II toxin-antitoxin system antitoxin SocA domain-containing protein [Pelagicoccus sp. SDUM812003]MDQ8202793.1 DUF4065 domain-containing protein [Pelagicoccus sp. SDUM812003]